jgi:hypothetical protein
MMSSRKLTRRDIKLTQRLKLNEDNNLMKFQKYINKLDSMDKIMDGKVDSKELDSEI